jgi:hypothetical protein
MYLKHLFSKNDEYNHYDSVQNNFLAFLLFQYLFFQIGSIPI